MNRSGRAAAGARHGRIAGDGQGEFLPAVGAHGEGQVAGGGVVGAELHRAVGRRAGTPVHLGSARAREGVAVGRPRGAAAVVAGQGGQAGQQVVPTHARAVRVVEGGQGQGDRVADEDLGHRDGGRTAGVGVGGQGRRGRGQQQDQERQRGRTENAERKHAGLQDDGDRNAGGRAMILHRAPGPNRRMARDAAPPPDQAGDWWKREPIRMV